MLKANKGATSGMLKIVSFLFLVALIIMIARISWWRPIEFLGENQTTYVSGVVHVHTLHSDGGGSVKEVASAAAEAGLDFVIITDHNTFGAKPFEGYVDGVLVIVGTEVSTTSGHVLGIGFPEPSFRIGGHPLDVIEDITDLGGMVFIAHPTSPRENFNWEAWSLPGNWGVEVLN